MRVRSGALLAPLVLAGCNARQRTDTRGAPAAGQTAAASAPPTVVRPAPPTTLAPWAEADSSCDFVRVTAHPSPDSLVAEFLARGAAGQFLRSDPWFDGATECPSHEAGPDEYTVISGYRTRLLSRDADSLAVQVTSRRIGHVESGHGFRADAGEAVDTVRAVRTAFGWRVTSPAPRQLVSESAAAARGDLRGGAAARQAP